MICGVILSGGFSKRFQLPGDAHIDKALYPINGIPMLVRVYNVLKEYADEVIIAAGQSTDDRINNYSKLVHGALIVHDSHELSGPLSGILASLKICNSKMFIIMPVDMPFLNGNVIKDLLEELRGRDITSIILPNGFIETLPMVLRTHYAHVSLEILKDFRRSRLTDLIRGAPRALLINAKERGYDPNTLANINRRDDLEHPYKYPEGPIKGDVEILRAFSLEDAVKRRLHKIRESLWGTLLTKDHLKEFRFYTSRGLYMLAAYTLMDSINDYERTLGRMIIDLLLGSV